MLVDDDGMFYMEWRDFCSCMGEIGACYPFVQTERIDRAIHCNTVVGMWTTQSAGGLHGLTTFCYNPRYSFVATDQSVSISLYQLDHRGHAIHVPWIDIALYLLDADMAADLFSRGQLKSRNTKQPGDLEPLIHLSRRLESRIISVKAGMEYTLVPCAHSVGIKGHFCITIVSRHGVELNQVELTHSPSEAERTAMTQDGSRAATCSVCGRGFCPESLYAAVPEGWVHADCFGGEHWLSDPQTSQ